MNRTNVDAYYSWNNSNRRDLRPNIYDRISKMADVIGNVKAELAREKELLSIEKIKNSYNPQNNNTRSPFPAYHSAEQLPIYTVYQNQQIPLSHQNWAHYEAQQYYQNMYSNFNNYNNSHNNSMRSSNNNSTFGIEGPLENILSCLELSQSDREILENERRKIQSNFKRQLADIDKQCKIENMHVKKNMNTLYRVSEQMLPKHDVSRKREHRKRAENYNHH